MQIRTLRPAERPALLELLDGWELADGWRGRDFFRRYLEEDPTYEDRNVWVAVEGARLLACVQIFPRPLRVRQKAVPCGGIGSVFTRRDRRRQGLASTLLEAAAGAMRVRGFELSLLVAERVDWYRGRGWEVLVQEGLTLTRGREVHTGPAGPELAITPFLEARDRGQLVSLHAAYSGARDGTVIRDRSLWRASLRCAGNPDETFLVARQGNELIAYLRSARLDGQTTLCEWGRREGSAAPLVALVDHVFAMAPGIRSAGLRLPPLRDETFRRGLEQDGYRLAPVPSLAVMVRLLDREALARRLGLAGPPGDLEEVLPRERSLFWPSDRF